MERTETGVRQINQIADSLLEQRSFPDLEGWEDTENKKQMAKAALAALRNYKAEQSRKAESQSSDRESRKRAMAAEEAARKRKGCLQDLSNKLTSLSKSLGTQEAGYRFQEWFYDVVEYFEVIARRPYVTDGRQIDGSVTLDGTTYLVELKFTREQADARDVDTFLNKVGSKADNTMGIMLSISGFSSVAVAEASGPRTPLLLFDYSHLYLLLDGGMTLGELVGRVRRYCSQTGKAYLNAHEFSL